MKPRTPSAATRARRKAANIRAAMAQAKAAGIHVGRPPTITPADLAAVRHLQEQEGLSVTEASVTLGLAPRSVYRHLRKARAAQGGQTGAIQ